MVYCVAFMPVLNSLPEQVIQTYLIYFVCFKLWESVGCISGMAANAGLSQF